MVASAASRGFTFGPFRWGRIPDFRAEGGGTGRLPLLWQCARLTLAHRNSPNEAATHYLSADANKCGIAIAACAAAIITSAANVS
jgi:hypothetical protein